MLACTHETLVPAVFELRTGDRTMRYAHHDGTFAAASTFGGRWRVTGPDGHPLLSLAPAGAPGTDDREVVPHGHDPLAVVMRDRRRGDAWVVHDRAGRLALRAVLEGAYEVSLVDTEGLPIGRLWATATAITVDFGVPPGPIHCLALALPLYFVTIAALRVESLDQPAPSLPLWG